MIHDDTSRGWPWLLFYFVAGDRKFNLALMRHDIIERYN